MHRFRPWLRERPNRHLTDAACQLVRERDFRLIGDRILDLSANGIRVGMLRPVLTGERLIVSFQLPSRLGWIDTEATVARVQHGRRPGDCVRAIGLEFESLDTELRRSLERDLGWLPIAGASERRRWRMAERRDSVG